MAKKGRKSNGEGSITQLKNGLWQARVSIRKPDGELKRIAFYGKTKKEAHEKLVKAQREIQTGSFVDPNKDNFGAWLSTWLSEYKKTKVSISTLTLYEYVARVYVLPKIGDIQLQKLETRDIQKIVNSMLEIKKSSRLIRLAHQIIKGSLKQAVKEQKVFRNVADAVELPKLVYKEIKPLSKEECKKILDTTKRSRDYPAYILEIATGLRRGELLALRWQDVDLKKGALQVKQSLSRISKPEGDKKTQLVFKVPKTKKSQRVIKIPANAIAELRQHRKRQSEEKLACKGEYIEENFVPGYKDHDLVFCKEDGRPEDPRAFTRRYEKALDKAGIPKTSFHALRHTAAVLLLQAGEKVKNVQELLGHENYSTTMDVYASYVPDDEKEKTACRMDAILNEMK
jgi:integrase